MPLVNIAITIVFVGIILWAVNRFIPMAASVKKILNLVVVVFLCVWLLQVFGIINVGDMSFR